MTTEVLVRKLNKEVETLQEDLREVKEFLFAPVSDAEGEYKDSFVKKVLARTGQVAPHFFSGRDSFLKHVRSRE